MLRKSKNKKNMDDNEKRILQSRILHNVLSVFVIIILIRQFMMGNYHDVFICVLTLALFMIPTIVNLKLNIKLPMALEVVIMLFIFAAEILGEIQSFYTIIPNWDNILHTINGFIMAAIGFAMIDIPNQTPRIHINMSPLFVSLVAFCFSMTVGVIWEFFEFGMDSVTGTDMQKDWIVNRISSVLINPSGLNDPIVIKDITRSVIYGEVNGQPVEWAIDGYLDIGVVDTMKDLIVNFIGAAIFSIIGFLYITGRGKGWFAKSFIPQLKTPKEIAETHARLETAKRLKRLKKERRKEKHARAEERRDKKSGAAAENTDN